MYFAIKRTAASVFDRQFISLLRILVSDFMSHDAKLLLRIRTASAIFWINIGIFRDYGLKILFFKIGILVGFDFMATEFQWL